MKEYNCKICGNNENNHLMIVREMLLGTREEFEYFQCANCGCLQIIEIPEDIARHYPVDKYYSYNMQIKTSKARDFFHKLLFYAYKIQLLPAHFMYLRAFSALPFVKNVKRDASILDIGCGDGRLIQDMGVWGWKNLTGIDPFVEKDMIYPSGVKILKQDIFEHNGQYDFIMMNDSLEHLDKQKEVFEQLNQLLTSGGRLLIRIPLVDCYVFRKYGIDSFHIDAPRHFFLHTLKSLSILAKNSGFSIESFQYDSSVRQFINSEKYSMGISQIEFENSKISAKRLKLLRKQIKILNATHDGDQAGFILKKNK